MLQDGEQGNRKTEAQQEPYKIAPVGPGPVGLHAKKEQSQQRRIFQQFNSRQERNGRNANCQLERRDQPKTKNGHSSGFQTNFNSPSVNAFQAQTSSKTAAPISSTASDQGSTAP